MPKLLDTGARADVLYEVICDLVMNGGLRAVTLRAVGRELELSTSSLRHHFDDRGRLLRYVLIRSAHSLGVKHWLRFPPGRQEGRRQAGTLLEAHLPLDDRRQVTVTVLYELLTAARSDATLASAAEGAEEHLVDACEAALVWIHQCQDDQLDPVEVAHLVALVDGLRRRLSDPHASLNVDQARAVLDRHLDHTASRLDATG
jgi:AcrR family transcriptional regulator